MQPIHRWGAAIAAVFGLLSLMGCDDQRIRELEEDVSTEVDVRDRFGVPENIWQEADGSRTFEYNRQPAGHQNYMITIGPDGRMRALRQVVAPHVFAQVRPGMTQQEVRRMLGKPAKRTTYDLKRETDWDWRYVEPPTTEMLFTVTFDNDGRVVRTGRSVVQSQG
ncbi:outer membrane protein assembly factor BamE domain-containing protein [Comamonas endophytica]|uniref:Outer membrane protein assembly factor BamE n=1 Tax=Comamonas endophytica TaxID=2949090 RepID=A0ABY6G6U9_9BURK|nr:MULTISPECIES: outer membrane protein assembly factor BamE [unclassified Acidovorax]MCD2511356.1 outer membrane protein assembly factor BamE [Acidovorax sp. D4N7]UYG50750.1 outer membrane protein assembly factor BamE [Acidovorax sp. 5MLIR]